MLIVYKQACLIPNLWKVKSAGDGALYFKDGLVLPCVLDYGTMLFVVNNSTTAFLFYAVVFPVWSGFLHQLNDRHDITDIELKVELKPI
jgi:hypothetical protein